MAACMLLSESIYPEKMIIVGEFTNIFLLIFHAFMLYGKTIAFYVLDMYTNNAVKNLQNL